MGEKAFHRELETGQEKFRFYSKFLIYMEIFLIRYIPFVFYDQEHITVNINSKISVCILLITWLAC